jgi:transcriptional regulator with GAF, ATPase, and Fis domain
VAGHDEMTLVADRFIRFDDGTVRDLATGDRVTLIEITLTGAAEQVARRDYCLARLDVQAGSGGTASRETAEGDRGPVVTDPFAPPLEGFALVDFGLVGESRWIEAYRTTGDAPASNSSGWLAEATDTPAPVAAPRDGGMITAPVVDAISATLDSLGSRDVRRLYVKAPENSRLDTFKAIVAREVRARGFIPVSASVVGASPAIAPLLASRSIVLFGDARCEFNSFVSSGVSVSSSIARAVALLHRIACVVAAIVARVCEHVNVAALRLTSDPSPPVAPAWPPQSVLQPAVAVSYDDPELPSLFPRTDQIAHVAETASLASFASCGPVSGVLGLFDGEQSSVITATGSDELAGTGTHEIVSESSEADIEEADTDGAPDRGRGMTSRYPPLRLVERRIRSEPAAHASERAPERAAVDIPVVTTMVSGYGEAVDLLVGRGRWAAASRALRAELAAYERRKQRHDAARTSIALGRLHLAMGEVGPAARCFDRAGELASMCGADGESGDSNHGSARLIGEALRWSGVAALDDADLERSERLLRGALAAIGPEADPHQVFAIELSLARCLFWQGRAREIVLPALDALSPGIAPARAAPAAVILRVERWRRVARVALVDGDLSSAGDAIARACRLARGDDDGDGGSAGCRIAIRVREVLRAACHLDAARLQFAIGDTGSGDVHLRESLTLSRVPARTARVQLLQLARFRNGRTSEARRRFERLSAALRQQRTPRLVRVQARYLIAPRGPSPRRGGGPLELMTFLDRHGDTALAGYGHPDRRGGSPMLEAFQDVLRICHETPDDLTALARVSAWLRDQLRALSVAIYGAAPSDNVVAGGSRQVSHGTSKADPSGADPFEADQNETQNQHETGNGERADSGSGAIVVRYAVAGSTRILSPGLAMRAIDSGLAIPPTYRPDALDAAAPVRYGGATIGAIVVRWSIDAALDHTNASALLGAAAAAVSPHLRAALDREQPDTGAAGAGAGSRSQARTLGLLGISSAIETLRHTITRVSSAPFHVLIEGESGSGKELVARALHQYGPRRHRRFCAVNCAAFTDELLEAELFGHTRGAFTGALTERAGLFEEADGGTLFLDEIGELSPRGQAKLLRVIQDGETRRIGENLPRRVDTRIVAATNRSLRDEANAGQFREDLLYRLDVIRIMVPPLRARPEDVPVLARAFWEEAIARLGSRATLDPATLTALARYHWPGNVRELHNAVMALAVHAPPRGRVTPSQLPATIRARPVAVPVAANDDAGDRATDDAKAGQSVREPLPFEGPLEDAKRAFESRYIRAALARAGGSPSRAASNLGLTRQGLTKLMARLGMNDDECRASPRRTTARKERPPP